MTVSVILRIALRNLKEHKSKSLIVGVIIALGIVVLFVSNSMMNTASAGIRKSFIDTYTGDIMISVKCEDKINIFGREADKLDPSVPTIPEYSKVYEYVTSRPEVLAASSQVTGVSIINFEETNPSAESDILGLILFGIEPENYKNVFRGNIEILDGEFLKSEEKGILITESQIEQIRDSMGISLSAGDSIVLSSFSAKGFKIKEIPIKGVIRFKSGTTLMDNIGLIDVQSLRSLTGLTMGSGEGIEPEKEEKDLLSMVGFDDLFSEDMVERVDVASSSDMEENLFSILGDKSERTGTIRMDKGAWHFILVRLKDSAAPKPVIDDLNNYFQEQGIQAKAVDWIAAAGMIGSFAYGIKIFINIVIIIIAFVAIFIIMNTLVGSVIERTSEIGTMRSLGAQKGFIRTMFILETLSIAVLSGCVGIIIGTAIIMTLKLTGLPATNIFFEFIFGGKVLYPELSLLIFIQTLCVVFLIGILASLYPVAIALKIQPIKAIQTE